MKCPLCSKDGPDAAEECPSCGAIFAKLRARREREREEALAALALIATPATAPNLSPQARQARWAVAAALIAAWILGLALYYYPRVARAHHTRKLRVSANSTAPMRGPVTGR